MRTMGWLQGRKPGHHGGHGRHGGPPGPTPQPTVWLHPSLLSSDIHVQRDEKAKHSGTSVSHHPRNDSSGGDHHEKPPLRVVMATVTRASSNDEGANASDDDDKDDKAIYVCTFPAPAGVSLGVFAENFEQGLGDGGDGDGDDNDDDRSPQEKKGKKPHHPPGGPKVLGPQWPDVSIKLRLPAGEPLSVSTVPPPPFGPPPPEPPHHRGPRPPVEEA